MRQFPPAFRFGDEVPCRTGSTMNERNEKKKSKKKLIIIGAVVVIAAAAFFVFKGKPAADGNEPEMTEAQAVRMTIENSISEDGQIVSALEEDVLPHTSYYLDEVKVEQGDSVKEGDTILTYTNGYEMEAPYDCVVESWELPNPEEQLTTDHYVTIAGTDVMMMELSVSEDEVSELELGEAATVTVDATGNSYDAEVSYISQVGSYSNGSSTFTVRVSFDNDGSVKLGMSSSVEIPLDRAENVIAVPVGAVSTRGGSSYVTVKKDDGEETVEVETGISNGSFIEIKSGLEEGDTVLVAASDDSSSGQWGGMPGGMSPPDGMSGMPSGGPPGGSGGPGGGGGSRSGS